MAASYSVRNVLLWTLVWEIRNTLDTELIPATLQSHTCVLKNPLLGLQECMKVPLASVRYSALQGLVEVLGLIESLPPSDAKVFAE